MIDAKHIIAGVLSRDKGEGEIIVRTSTRNYTIKDLEKEFTERNNELFPGEGLLWDGWKVITNANDDVMKIFYTTPGDKEELNRYKDRRKHDIENQLPLDSSVLSDDDKEAIITKLFMHANEAREIVDEERGWCKLGRKVMELLDEYA